MFNAEPDNAPAADVEAVPNGATGQLPGPKTYPTPPQLDPAISDQQRAAVEGDVKLTTESSGRTRGTVVGLAFGALLGPAVGLLSRKGLLWKTGTGGVLGATGGWMLSSATWKHKPDIEAPTASTTPPLTEAAPLPSPVTNHTEKLAASRASAPADLERA